MPDDRDDALIDLDGWRRWLVACACLVIAAFAVYRLVPQIGQWITTTLNP